MSSAVKPLTATSSPAGGNQVNKNMHPQGTASYSQPAHVPQSLANMHTNTNVAHNHQNQQHHYSLNVPNTSGHFTNQNMGQIPASNHPIANASATAAGQGYSPQKNAANFSTNFQANLAHQQNQNVLSAISQNVPSTTHLQSSLVSQNSITQAEKTHSNGTSEAQSLTKPDNKDSVMAKEKLLQSSNSSQQGQDKPLIAQLDNVTDPNPATPSPQISKSPQIDSTTDQPASVSDTLLNPTESDKSVKSQDVEKSPKLPEKDSDQSETADTKSSSSESENIVKKPENESGNKSEISEQNVKSTQQTVVENKPNSEQSTVKDIQAKSPVISASTVNTPKTARSKTSNKSDELTKTAKEPKTSVQKSPSTGKAKRQRIRTQPYQSPLPEMELISKISSSTPRTNDDKLIVFYRNEFLAVRNAEGSFYLCQAVQNIYKSSSKIKIRWLSLVNDKSGEIYTPDFYDLTDFDCILTNLTLTRVEKGKFRLPPSEKERTESILQRSLAVEKGEVTSPSLTEEHPDGLDLSLYKDEDQLKKRNARKRKASQKRAQSTAVKSDATKKSPTNAKVRKVSDSVKTTKKPVAVKKAAAIKKMTVPADSKKSASTSRTTSRSKSKVPVKTSSVVDQKKAKVLAKIGRKTAAKPSPSSSNSSKNAKPGVKQAAVTTSKKAAPKASVKAQPRNSKRSTRK
ncbi:hypothetical protein GWI33_022268 [Rhynchophorus ferrugineus]|uniref:Uncharacterized protein n=1 Tax=Rhynchophorus ferrugineus TaxID=354439 RepID=A0A834J0H2_RHYFE|nr:hypothetical protein GWI33_022268 [Rhynchophorus ferrugineus]